MKESMESFKEKAAKLGKNYWNLVILGFTGCIIGICVSIFEVIFGYGLETMIHIHQSLGNWLLIGLPLAGVLIVWLFQICGGSCIKGMNLVFEVSQGISKRIPKRLVPLMIIGTWLSNLFGASVGREGVAMQIGAAISNLFQRFFPDLENGSTIFLVAGMAAGFAGLFGTPFTAIFFALEVLVAGVLKYRAMAPTLTAAFSASWFSSLFGIQKSAIDLVYPFDFDMTMIFPLIVLGLVFGLVGGAFAFLLRLSKQFFTRRFPDPYVRIFVFGWVAAFLLFIVHDGRYSMLGENLIDAALSYQTVYPYDWICKFGLTVFCLSIGFMGGEVTPLFAIGSTLGSVIAPFLGFSPIVGAALGYAAVFGAGTNTYLAPIMIGMEIFGFQYFPLFFIVCSIAYLVNQNKSIYALQQREG